MNEWHAMTAAQVVEQLHVEPGRGLSAAEAAQRLRRYGPNQTPAPMPLSVAVRLGRQLTQPLVLVLIAAALMTLLMGEWIDAGVISGVVVVNAVIGFLQEGKAEAALAALSKSLAVTATVLREGRLRNMDASGLVQGDVVMLCAGDKVPADCYLLESKGLRTTEAALTGESTPVEKKVWVLPPELPVADRTNMVFAGTLVLAGLARAVVVETGALTQSGRIAGLIAGVTEIATPMTKKMAEFSRRLLWLILILAMLTFAVGVARGAQPFAMFMAAVALAVAAIPEGLPAAMTITLAIGVAQMAKRRAIIRKLPAVETLGRTTVICSDKTGTLTENAMTVRSLWIGGEPINVSGHGYGLNGTIVQGGGPAQMSPALRELLLAGVLCNDARLWHDEHQKWHVEGDPTEAALLVVARKAGLDEITLQEMFPRIDELPFDSTHQLMATLHQMDGARIVCVKGAAEKLLIACKWMIDPQGNEIPFAAAEANAALQRMTQSGLRVLALARVEIGPSERLDHVRLTDGLVFAGLAGMIDPPRPRAIEAVRTCQSAGIQVKMITGDHPGTALAVAHQLGIAPANAVVLTGQDLSKLDAAALRSAAHQTTVFARVAPEQKLWLVQALQANGEVVAMTGDGVNDAPALKQADIGLAMGVGGTEVAKEAADVVLTDDNFATIEAAIEAGRGIYDNLVKFIVWTIPTNAGEGLLVLTAVIVGASLPITPLQILWINMTTSVLLGLMLAFEPVERGIMMRPPRRPDAPILDRALVRRIMLVASMMLLGAFGLFELALQQGKSIAQARTIAANVFVVTEVLYLFNCRSLTQPFWRIGVNSNLWVWLGAGMMLSLQLLLTYLPVLNNLFETAPIGLPDWLMIAGSAGLIFVTVEWEKWWQRHRR